MAVIETWFEQDLQKPVKVRYIDGNLFSHNGNGNRIGVIVTNNGEAVTLTGTVSGYAVLADGTTVPCTGSRSGNKASILVPAAAYSPGSILISIFLTDGTTVTTLAALSSSVIMARTGNQIDPGSVVTDWTNTINAAMQSVETAAANLGNIIATPYANLTFPVPLGKYTIYNNGLYRCISPIASSEEWTAAHWMNVKLGDDVADLKSATNKSDKISKNLLNGTYLVENDFVQSSYGTDSFITTPPTLKAICTTLGYLAEGTVMHIVSNGQAIFLRVFEKPAQTENNTQLSILEWQTGTFDYIVPVSGYICINIASNVSYSSRIDITPADYAMEITVETDANIRIESNTDAIENTVADTLLISDGLLLNNSAYGYRSASGLSNAYRTPILSCKPGDVFTYFGRADYNYAAVYFKNANRQNIKREQTANAVGTYTFTAPENAYFAEFSSYGTDKFNVYIDNQKAFGPITAKMNKIAGLENPIANKSLLFIGDSITEGVGYNGGWVTLIQQRNNCSCTNQGHGGWTIGKTPGSSNNLLRLLPGMADNYDYVILSGGYNDFTTSPRAEIGELTPYTYSELTAETFAGDLEAYIRTARTKWINAKLGFILTMKKEFNDTTVNDRQVQYWDIIRAACKKYSIPLLDLYNESGLVGVVVDNVIDLATQTYYNANTTFPNGDGTHPNTAGYAYLVQRVEDFVKGL